MRTIKLKTLQDKIQKTDPDPVVEALSFVEIVAAHLSPNGGSATSEQRLAAITAALNRYRETQPLFPYSYREAALAVLLAPVAEMRIDRLRIIDKLYGLFEQASDGDVISLEEEEYRVFLTKLAEVQFTGYNRYLVRFVDDIEGAPVLDLNVKKKEKEG